MYISSTHREVLEKAQQLLARTVSFRWIRVVDHPTPLTPRGRSTEGNIFLRASVCRASTLGFSLDPQRFVKKTGGESLRKEF